MIRVVILLALFVLPLFAQEEPAPDPHEAKMHDLLQRMIDGSAEEKETARAELLEYVLRRRNATEDGGILRLGPLEAKLVVVTSGSGAPSEQMSGSWEEDGKKGRYSLRSLKPGRYFLKSWVQAPEGKETVTEEEGSLGELRRKFSFLKDVMIVGMQPIHGPDIGLAVRGAISRNGLAVSRPSEELRYHLALPEGAGLLVEQVERGSEADRLGLERFDLVMKVGEDLVTRREQLENLEGKRVQILRRAQPRTLGK